MEAGKSSETSARIHKGIDGQMADCRETETFGADGAWKTEDSPCEYFLLGLAEGFAAIGQRHAGSQLCVAPGFDFEAYGKGLIATLGRDGLDETARLAAVVDAVSEGEETGRNCAWSGEDDLESLGEACRWLAERNPNSERQRDLVLRSEATGRRSLKKVIDVSVSHCFGYITGFMTAAAISEEVDETPAFCNPWYGIGERPKGAGSIMHNRLRLTAAATVAALESHERPSEEPAMRHVYDALSAEFPCEGD